MKKLFRNIIIALIAILMVSIVVLAFFFNSLPKPLYPGEVTNYQGQDLSKINDFIENSIKGPQQVNASTYHLRITGLVNKTVEYTYEQVLSSFQKYQKVVTLHCVEGWSVKILWEGFLVKDLLDQAGIDPKANTVIFYAYDGYSSALPLEYITKNNIIIAYKINGLTLPPQNGFPFQLVAESNYGYKWVKWITRIEVSNDSSYLGYWESRGFPNNATIP
jgi:DMSO/TMAO reductase YedYZ molybdopterin-dependent catalytic subunit